MYNVSRAVTIPSGRPSGTNYIWAILDVSSTANQSNETNDKDYEAFTVTASAPAPSISSVSPNPVTGSTSSQWIILYGTNFQSRLSVYVTWTGGSKTLESWKVSVDIALRRVCIYINMWTGLCELPTQTARCRIWRVSAS